MRVCLLWALFASLLFAESAAFRQVPVASDLKMGYQVVVADLNNDKRPDLIVVEERATELAWYENPTWQRHTLAQNVSRVINLECQDLDGDGVPEIALAHGFERSAARSKGTILLLKSGADPRQPWAAKEIDAVPTAHRLRWAKTENGPILLVSPLAGPSVDEPTFEGKTPIYFYKPGEWKRTLLYGGLNGIVHSIHPMDWDGTGRDQILTASFDGIKRLEPMKDGTWRAHDVAKGDPRPCPLCGASEIKPGRLGRARFIAAIEPWHGNQVVVYLEEKGREDKGRWTRHVLDDSMENGHALAVGDLDGDGRDEIVAGFRGKGHWIAVFKAVDPKGTKWSREIIDETVAAADCKIADFNGDKRPDFACSGASTGNLKIYENRPASR